MSTRSLTIIKDDTSRDVCVMYRHHDGYPCDHGQELINYLRDAIIVNGLTDGDKRKHNGVGCLAASLVAHFKKGPGDIYLEPSGARNVGEHFVYIISNQKGKLRIKVEGLGMPLWEGLVDEVENLGALCCPPEDEA